MPLVKVNVHVSVVTPDSLMCNVGYLVVWLRKDRIKCQCKDVDEIQVGDQVSLLLPEDVAIGKEIVSPIMFQEDATGITLYYCSALQARITEDQCRINKQRALNMCELKVSYNHGRLKPCIECPGVTDNIDVTKKSIKHEGKRKCQQCRGWKQEEEFPYSERTGRRTTAGRFGCPNLTAVVWPLCSSPDLVPRRRGNISH